MVIQWQFHWGFHGHIGHCPMIYGDYLGIKHEKLLISQYQSNLWIRAKI